LIRHVSFWDSSEVLFHRELQTLSTSSGPWRAAHLPKERSSEFDCHAQHCFVARSLIVLLLLGFPALALAAGTPPQFPTEQQAQQHCPTDTARRLVLLLLTHLVHFDTYWALHCSGRHPAMPPKVRHNDR
jgi:hypothetical protein